MLPGGPPTKKRKGGVQQRLAKAAQEQECQSALYALLMTHFAKGLMSGALIHSIAKAAQQDLENAASGLKITELKKIASLEHAKNLGPMLTRMMAKESTLPDPLQVHMPMKGSVDHTPSAAILLPHEYFAAMYQKDEAWEKCILPDPAKLPGFWNSFEGHPCMQSHPCRRRKGWKSFTIPLGLHGDEVPVLGTGKIWCKCALVFSWFSIMASAGGAGFQDAHLYIWGIFEKYVVPAAGSALGTMEVFWTIMKWSFSALASGKYPLVDWQGQPFALGSKEARRAGKDLAEGYCAILLQLAGDLDYMSKWLETPRVTNHEKPCPLCRASFAGPMSYLDNRKDSPWQASLLMPSNYKEHWSPKGPLYTMAGFSNQCLAMDFMHTMHLGWLQHFFGSVIHLLVYYLLEGEPLDNLQFVYNYIKQHQKKNQAKHPYKMKLDKLTMFQPKKGYPKLRGRAADIAGLAHCLHDLWQEQMQAGDEWHARVRLFLQYNLELKRTLETFSPTYGFTAIPQAQYDKVFQAGLTMAQLHKQLSEHFEAQDIKIFNVTSKTHFALHSLQFSKYIHPFLLWCYKGESTMHRAQTLWKSCLAGSKHWQASKKAAWKERHLMWLQGKL